MHPIHIILVPYDFTEQAEAALDADLITMGTHGRTGLAPMLHGGAAERMLRRAPCPVVTVPAHRTGRQAAAHVAPQMASRSS